ncbi:MAG: 30S ribosomal protein S3 [Alphaproteobacteria bacterium GM202ARS2]|nr:30S ribosomal protein S3 [Alphaproteobacteria bacterium GM202ARS2]
MGQKTNPIGFRLGINRTWDSRWYAYRKYAQFLREDIKIRHFLKKRLQQAGLSRVLIERKAEDVRVTILAARPGVVIGKKGADIEKLRKTIRAISQGNLALDIKDVRKPEIDAHLIADNIAHQLERRVAFRRAVKRAMQAAERMGVKGIRIHVGGRLGGAEIARTEAFRYGQVPLHTLRADIDYGTAVAHTTYGTCGVKVWVYHGDIYEHDSMAQERRIMRNQKSSSTANSETTSSKAEDSRAEGNETTSKTEDSKTADSEASDSKATPASAKDSGADKAEAKKATKSKTASKKAPEKATAQGTPKATSKKSRTAAKKET